MGAVAIRRPRVEYAGLNCRVLRMAMFPFRVRATEKDARQLQLHSASAPAAPSSAISGASAGA